MSEKQIPDAVEVTNGTARVGTVVTEDKLTEAIRKENEPVEPSEPETPVTQSAEPVSVSEELTEALQEIESTQEQEITEETVSTQATEMTPDPVSDSASEIPVEAETIATPEPVYYTIQKGDTLIGICLLRYGSEERVAEICSLNNIGNPDDIKTGEKILLPQ